MTFLAAIPELALVNIVFAVTGLATFRCLILIQVALVTTLALYRLMFVAQDVFRVAIMIERTMFPALGDVARLTLVPILSLVQIVFFVAGNTGCRGCVFC